MILTILLLSTILFILTSISPLLLSDDVRDIVMTERPEGLQ